ENVVQFLESFRTLRMHMTNTLPANRMRVAVTSTSPGDGKSLVSTNLALSCAKAGLRTLIVDGDTRRGMLHRTFGLSMKDGLTDFMHVRLSESHMLKTTPHDNLFMITCGHRTRTSPE